MDALRVCSLEQITHALFEVGGQYRRNMSRDHPTTTGLRALGAGNRAKSRSARPQLGHTVREGLMG